MKILQVIFTLGVGGAETFVVDLCNELCKNNDVTLCVIENENNINAIYQKSKSLIPQHFDLTLFIST